MGTGSKPGEREPKRMLSAPRMESFRVVKQSPNIKVIFPQRHKPFQVRHQYPAELSQAGRILESSVPYQSYQLRLSSQTVKCSSKDGKIVTKPIKSHKRESYAPFHEFQLNTEQ